MAGPSGQTTEAFVDTVAERLSRYLAQAADPDWEAEAPVVVPDPKFRRNYNVDEDAVKAMFESYDTDSSGTIDVEEFTAMLVKLNMAPQLTKEE